MLHNMMPNACTKVLWTRVVIVLNDYNSKLYNFFNTWTFHVFNIPREIVEVVTDADVIKKLIQKNDDLVS